MIIRCTAVGQSDLGRLRTRNEDAFRIDETRGIFLVADGMGGHAAGDIASRIAVQVVGDALAAAVDAGVSPADGLPPMLDAFVQAQAEIENCCTDNPKYRGMGTTLTALLLFSNGTYHIGHIGDSRAYCLRSGSLKQITHDHTWVQREVDAGRLSMAAARQHQYSHVITRALGAGAWAEPDLLSGTAEPGDLLLLASDGLTGMVSDSEIEQLLDVEKPLDAQAQALVDAANQNGGRDNITVVLVRLDGAVEPSESASAGVRTD